MRVLGASQGDEYLNRRFGWQLVLRQGSTGWIRRLVSDRRLGDVLAGFWTGWMARGMKPMLAADVGARLRPECGPYLGSGLIAEELPEAIPEVLRAVGCGPIQDG